MPGRKHQRPRKVLTYTCADRGKLEPALIDTHSCAIALWSIELSCA